MELEQTFGVVFGGFGVTHSLNGAQRFLSMLEYDIRASSYNIRPVRARNRFVHK